MSTIIGADEITKTGESRGWSPDRGETFTEQFKGPVDKIKARFDALVNDPEIDSVERGIDDGIGTLSVTIVDDTSGSGGGSSEELNTTWEVIGQDLYKNIKSFDGFGVDAARLRFNADAFQPALEDVRKDVEQALNFDVALLGEPMKTYAQLLRRGVDEYVRSAAVLRKTVNVASRSLLKASWKGVDKAWKLDGEEGSPGLDQSGQGALIGAISEMPDFLVDKKQWLKRAPQIRQVSRRRFGIVTEWWFAKYWSATLYKGDAVDGNP